MPLTKYKGRCHIGILCGEQVLKADVEQCAKFCDKLFHVPIVRGVRYKSDRVRETLLAGLLQGLCAGGSDVEDRGAIVVDAGV